MSHLTPIPWPRPSVQAFQGEHRYLSNFWPVPVVLDGVVYPTVEHAYQAAKHSPEYEYPVVGFKYRQWILTANRPGIAKQRGKHMEPPNWRELCKPIMLELLRQKFTCHKNLFWALQNTRGLDLIEGNNWHDTYWGICTGQECWRGPHEPIGENNLGQLIMQVRSEL